MDSLSQLKVILKNSFAGIKKDMADLKQAQEEGLGNSYKIKQDVDSIKNDYVPKDKFNLLKIQVGEVNDQLRKIWDLEKEIKKINEKKTDRTEFEKEVEKFREDVSKKFSENNSNFNKKIAQLNDKTAGAFDKVNESLKVFVTKNQVSSLISDVNNEFNSLKAGVEEIKKIKDTITAKELERRTGIINARIDLLAKELVRANQKIAECVTGEQVKKLIEEINGEFNDIKHSVSELSKLRNFVKVLDSDSVKSRDFSRKAADLHSELEKSRKEVQELKDFLLKNYSKNDEMKRMVNSIEINFSRKISELADEIISLKKSESSDIKKLKEKIKEEKPKFMEIKEKAEKIDKTAKPRNYRALSIISVILIVLAFLSLAGAVISYFALEPEMTNYLTIGAVALFVIGIVMRVIIVRKRK